MSTLEKTSAEIRRLDPRLMERKFGCKVRNKRGDDIIIEAIDSSNVRLTQGIFSADKEDWDSYFTIIGHPITLEHVLEAFLKKGIWCRATPMHNGINIETERDECTLEYGLPYSEQSPEVHDFVEKILFTK